ncbi:MAG: transposase [Candidatus Coatesbacteria bacterium]|nr:transposase [Candidatus Coatesbacteria bacterium]
MQRIPPSQRLRQRVNHLLDHGLQGEGDVANLMMRLGGELLLQELLEGKSKDYLGRDHYERRDPDQAHRGYRNGYEPGHVRTSEGELSVQVPQIRDTPEPYQSKLMQAMGRSSEVLERLVVQMYVRGLSTRDIEAALEEATGEWFGTKTVALEIAIDRLYREEIGSASPSASKAPTKLATAKAPEATESAGERWRALSLSAIMWLIVNRVTGL